MDILAVERWEVVRQSEMLMGIYVPNWESDFVVVERVRSFLFKKEFFLCIFGNFSQ